MNRRRPDFLIAGASARAAAFSAVQAGLTVAAADLFADRDLQAIAETTVIDDWPAGIEHWAETFDRGIPLIYVGGLENSSELLERIAVTRPVYGVVGELLGNIRTPEFVALQLDTWSVPRPALMSFDASLRSPSPWGEGPGVRGYPAGPLSFFSQPDRSREAGSFAETASNDSPHPRPLSPGRGGKDRHVSENEVADRRRWLVKPRRGAGGRGVRWWTETATPPSDGEYVQEFIDGSVGSVAYLASEVAVELLGVTELLLPDASRPSSLSPFAYCGSITVELSDTEPLERLGQCLAATGLRGLFGVDFVRRETPAGPEFIPIEVNPRYTAGMEVLERRDSRSFLANHVAAFATERRHGPHGSAGTSPLLFRRDYHGKRIVYAPRQCRAGELPVASLAAILATPMRFDVADVPQPGTIIPAGAPICTVFATGTTREACFDRLRTLESDVVSRCEPA